MLDPGLSLSGFFVGTLVGMTGVGGGALMTPLLILVFGISPTTAVGTDLAYATITKIFASISYIRRGQVNFPYIRWLIVGSVPSALIAVLWILPWMRGLGIDPESFIPHLLGVMLVLVGVVNILEHWFFSGQLRDSRLIRNRHVQKRFKEPILVLGGVLIGLGVGLTSVGSGSVLMAILLLVSELPVLVLIGTDIVHATVLLGSAGIAHWFAGNVDWAIVLSLLVGSVPGVWLGSRLAQHVPTGPLRIALALLLVGTGVKLAIG
ncbi:MAG: sulfite exporter TauE/SafE family protein [bacterium]